MVSVEGMNRSLLGPSDIVGRRTRFEDGQWYPTGWSPGFGQSYRRSMERLSFGAGLAIGLGVGTLIGLWTHWRRDERES